MKILARMLALLTLALGITSCASIPCAPPDDQATCDVHYAIQVADQVDVNLQALLTGIPLSLSVRNAIAAYHLALPAAEKSASDALDAYEATHAGDYTTAVKFLIALYADISKVIVAAGQPDPVTAAKAAVTK
jgi:hypothetical protein